MQEVLRNAASVPGLGRSPGEGNGYPLQYSCLENPIDTEAWQARGHRLQRLGHDWSNLACMHSSTVSWVVQCSWEGGQSQAIDNKPWREVMVASLRLGAMSKKEVSGIRMFSEHKTNRIYCWIGCRVWKEKENQG